MAIGSPFHLRHYSRVFIKVAQVMSEVVSIRLSPERPHSIYIEGVPVFNRLHPPEGYQIIGDNT